MFSKIKFKKGYKTIYNKSTNHKRTFRGLNYMIFWPSEPAVTCIHYKDISMKCSRNVHATWPRFWGSRENETNKTYLNNNAREIKNLPTTNPTKQRHLKIAAGSLWYVKYYWQLKTYPGSYQSIHFEKTYATYSRPRLRVKRHLLGCSNSRETRPR